MSRRYFVPTFLTLLALAMHCRADALKLTSPAFTDGGSLPAEFTCDGESAQPPLAWTNVPPGTKSFAITMHHIPGPGDQHVYLVLYRIPGDTTSLAKNAKDVGVFGINTVNQKQEYTPPCSKGPGPKKYTITLYALSNDPKIDGQANAVTMEKLLKAIEDRTLAKAEINVTYDRKEKGTDARGPGRLPPEKQALSGLNLNDDQKQKVDSIMNDFRDKQEKLRDDLLKQIKTVLDPAQYEQFEKSFKRPPPPPEDDPNHAAAPQAPAGIPVTFTGGHETDPRDGGRPVVLIAAGLKVPTEVFREAFTHVTPARGEEPKPEQVQKNKQALLNALGKYGVDNDTLDTVSNFYRYNGAKGEMWRTTPAEAYATIKDGVVTSITITNPGAGYTTPPKISIAGFPNVKPTITFSFGEDLKKNGSIQEIKLDPVK